MSEFRGQLVLSPCPNEGASLSAQPPESMLTALVGEPSIKEDSFIHFLPGTLYISAG